jgi:O-antigen ligase
MGNSDPKLADLVESKRSVDALPLLIWPACLALAVVGSAWAGAILAVAFAVACVKLTASSATLGMFISLLIFAATFASIKWVRRGLAGLTFAAFILVIPVAFLAYDHGGTHAHWLKRSAQHRVEIWHFTAGRILERPLLGWGFNASRSVPNGDAVSEFLAPDKPIIPLHPHNAFLQVWLELGAVGVAVVAALLLLGLNGIGRWQDERARFALAGYAAGTIVAGLAFGLWQTWWMATLAFAAAAYRLIGANYD